MAKRKSKPKSAFDNVYVKAGAVTVGLVVLYSLFNKSKAATVTSKKSPQETIKEYKANLIAQQNSYGKPTQNGAGIGSSIGSSALAFGSIGAVAGPIGFAVGAFVGAGVGIFKAKKVSEENEAYFANSTFVKRIPDGINKCGEVVLKGPDGVEYRIDRIDYEKFQNTAARMHSNMAKYNSYDDDNFGVKTGLPKCTENFPTPIADAENAVILANKKRIEQACNTVEGRKTLNERQLSLCSRNTTTTINNKGNSVRG